LRSIKYFITLALVVVLSLLVLVKMGLAEGDVSTMFVHGYDSLWQIAAIMAVFSFIYPRFGYTTRGANLKGETSDIRHAVDRVMEARGYRLKSVDGENMSFVKRSPFARILKVFQDELHFTRTISGYDIEGRTKDVVRIVGALENNAYICDD